LLPEYSSRKKLKEKLKIAIENSRGFGVIWASTAGRVASEALLLQTTYAKSGDAGRRSGAVVRICHKEHPIKAVKLAR